jgi:glycine hydroxymethyltransferase
MKEAQMKEIAKVIFALLSNAKAMSDPKTGKVSKAKTHIDPKIIDEAREGVAGILREFPLYPELG